MANSIRGITAGQSGSFSAIPVPAQSVVTGVPVWASDNALAVVSPDTTDVTGLSITVAVDATATGSFNLTVTSTNPDGSTATGTANVPVLPAPPKAVVSFDIVQSA